MQQVAIVDVEEVGQLELLGAEERGRDEELGCTVVIET